MVNIFVKSFIISLFLFLIGIGIGMGIEKIDSTGLFAKTTSIENSIQEIELEMLYFQNLNSSTSCTFLNDILGKTNNNLDILSSQLEKYSDRNIIFTGDLADIKEKYTGLAIKSWLLNEQIKTNCGPKSASLLYFYQTQNCNDCAVQGNILTNLKQTYKDKLLVYPLDVGVKLDLINILQERYNITSFPSVVIGDTVFKGIVGKGDIIPLICQQLGNVTGC